MTAPPSKRPTWLLIALAGCISWLVVVGTARWVIEYAVGAEPVAVRIEGVSEGALGRVVVPFGKDLRGRIHRILATPYFETKEHWVTNPVLVVPEEDLAAVAELTLFVGTRPQTFLGAEVRQWQRVPSDRQVALALPASSRQTSSVPWV